MSSGRPNSIGPKVALVAGGGALVVGVAIWASKVGPWTSRSVSPNSAVTAFPTLTNLPNLTLRPPQIPPGVTNTGSGSASKWLLIILLAVVLIGLAAMAALYLRNRPSRRDPEAEELGAVPLTEPSGPHPEIDHRVFDTARAADSVIASWQRMESAATGVGLSRRPEQTPTEFLATVNDRCALDSRAAGDLLGLYQHARFDHVALRPDSVGRAGQAADSIIARLWSTSAQAVR